MNKLTLAFALCLFLPACGIKGPLVLPPPAKNTVAQSAPHTIDHSKDAPSAAE